MPVLAEVLVWLGGNPHRLESELLFECDKAVDIMFSCVDQRIGKRYAAWGSLIKKLGKRVEFDIYKRIAAAGSSYLHSREQAVRFRNILSIILGLDWTTLADGQISVVNSSSPLERNGRTTVQDTWAAVKPYVQCAGRLFSNPWFRRLWVIQEVCNGRNVTVRHGLYETSWRVIQSMGRAQYAIISEIKSSYFCSVHSDFVRATSNLPRLPALWAQLKPGGKLSCAIPDTFLFTTYFLATDSRDHVYAIAHLGDNSALQDLQADYNKDCRDVYIECTRMIINRDGNFSCLNLANGDCGFETGDECESGEDEAESEENWDTNEELDGVKRNKIKHEKSTLAEELLPTWVPRYGKILVTPLHHFPGFSILNLEGQPTASLLRDLVDPKNVETLCFEGIQMSRIHVIVQMDVWAGHSRLLVTGSDGEPRLALPMIY